MSSPRIVLVSDSASDDAVFGSLSGIVHVRMVDNALIAHTENGEEAFDVPASTFHVRQYVKSDLGPWLRTLDWLAMLASDSGVVVFDFKHPLRELMFLWRARGQRFGLFYSSEPSRISVTEYALLSSTDCCVFFDEAAESEFRKHYVGSYRPVLLSEQWGADLAELLLAGRLENTADDAVCVPITEGRKKRLLIVSYFSGPCRTVGVQRVNYWADYLQELSDGEFDVHLATASYWPEGSENVHFVPDTELASMLGDEQRFPAWAAALKAVEDRDAKCFSTLSFYWRIALEAYFEASDLEFDAVIISGNPFAVFDFSAFAKRRWGAQVILDYRDPFANNPRMKFSDAARAHARYVEKGYNLQADAALTVNSVCADLVVASEELSVHVIGNGYNDRDLKNIDPIGLDGDAVKFVHAGSFYYFGSPTPLVSALERGKHELHHIGKLAGASDEVVSSSTFISHGIKPYSETLGILSGADCGVVYVSDAAFETPTKMYDYLALGLDILICTDGEPWSGALGEVLLDHPNVYWCKNTEEEIAEFLSAYTPRAQAPGASHRFSRAAEAQKLIDVLRKLVNPGFVPPELHCV
ncbi:hypothetical protein [Hoeflea sp.]|uniref:hypothetical protein n=1 Tax=Hoeflea sp. TaxID=1940281 RepID=UPI003A95D6B7